MYPPFDTVARTKMPNHSFPPQQHRPRYIPLCVMTATLHRRMYPLSQQAESNGENPDSGKESNTETASSHDSSSKAGSELNDRGPHELQSKDALDKQEKSKEVALDEESVRTSINVRAIISSGLSRETIQPEEPDEIVCTGARKRKVIVGGVGGDTRETAIDLTKSSKSIYDDCLEPWYVVH